MNHSGGAASPAAKNPIPLPRVQPNFYAKRPGGSGYNPNSYSPHSKCSTSGLGLETSSQSPLFIQLQSSTSSLTRTVPPQPCLSNPPDMSTSG